MAAGAIVFRESSIILAHIKNIITLKQYATPLLEGKIRYKAKLLYIRAALDDLCLAAILAIATIITKSIYLLGGTLSVGGTIIAYWHWVKKINAKTLKAINEKLVT